MNNYLIWSDALFQLAKEENKIEEFKFISQSILDLLKEDQTFISFFKKSNIKTLNLNSFWKEIFENENSDFLNFILLSIEENQYKNIEKIFLNFIKQANASLKIVEAIVWTTYKLDSNILNSFKEKLELRIKRKIEIKNNIDFELIGGAKIQLEDYVVDHSIKNSLVKISKEMVSK